MLSEVVLPRRVVPQPTPNLNPGGDCGACVLAGLLSVGVRDVYERFREGKILSLQRTEMRSALMTAEHEKRLDRIVTEAPMWPHTVYSAWQTFGTPAHLQSMEWFAYVRMAIDAGYYGLAAVNFAKEGPLSHGSDHWVMICGHRQRMVPNPRVANAWDLPQEILISCSARSSPDEEWVEVNEFLRQRGGFDVMLARPV